MTTENKTESNYLAELIGKAAEGDKTAIIGLTEKLERQLTKTSTLMSQINGMLDREHILEQRLDDMEKKIKKLGKKDKGLGCVGAEKEELPYNISGTSKKRIERWRLKNWKPLDTDVIVGWADIGEISTVMKAMRALKEGLNKGKEEVRPYEAKAEPIKPEYYFSPKIENLYGETTKELFKRFEKFNVEKEKREETQDQGQPNEEKGRSAEELIKIISELTGEDYFEKLNKELAIITGGNKDDNGKARRNKSYN